MTGAITFNSNSIQTFNPTTQVGIITDDIDLDSLADRALSIYALAHANASVIPFDSFPSKTIPVTGTIVGSSTADLDSRLDAFKAYFNGKDKNLDIEYNSSTRRFIATANGLSIKRSANKKYAKFSLQFFCTIPFGTDTSNTTALNATARTGNVYSDSYTFLGSAPAQLPVVTITLTAVSSTGSQQLAWGNNDTGQGIVITSSTWLAGDVLVIDCVNKTVKINGVDVDFSGAFPEFSPGSHPMTYSDTFTSRTMNENVVYKKRYA